MEEMKQFSTPFLLTLAVLLISIVTKGQTIISANDFGVKSDSYQNASPAIRKAIEACKSKDNVILKLPGGRIDLWPDGATKEELYISNSTEDDTLSKVKSIGFCFEDFNNLTLEGNNTEVILHGKMISFAILNSKKITLKNISFDYERPTMSELTLQSVSDSCIETLIHPDSKYRIEKGKFFFYGEGWRTNGYHTIVLDTATGRMKYSSFKPFITGTATETNPYFVTFKGDFSKYSFQKLI